MLVMKVTKASAYPAVNIWCSSAAVGVIGMALLHRMAGNGAAGQFIRPAGAAIKYLCQRFTVQAIVILRALCLR